MSKRWFELHSHDKKDKAGLNTDLPQILLIGNPNVGKSVIFSKLTGNEVMASNYAGTTVSFSSGTTVFENKKANIIDVPGTYSLDASSDAERVAVQFLSSKVDNVIFVLDATNLERNLNFALQVRELGLPMVFALNLIDVAEQKGIHIDVKTLEEELGFPVVPTVAVRNIGLALLAKKAFSEPKKEDIQIPEKMTNDQRWGEVGRIISKVQRLEHRHATFLERLGDQMIMPFPGILIAFFVLALSLGIVVGGGKALRSVLLLPIVNDVYAPFIQNLVSSFIAEGMLRNILIGEYGVLIKGIEWPFALVLPYVFLFYIVFSFLEDTGYLPRLGVLADSLMRRIGVQGGDLIPMIMGYGCAVPAILGSRNATTYKQRLIVSSLVALAIPCASQTGAFIALLGERSWVVLILVYIVSLLTILITGMILRKIVPGKSDTILIEVPNLLWPNLQAWLKKIWIRTKHFMFEAEVPMLLGIVVAALVAETGILLRFSVIMEPIVVHWLGLPKEATISLILGVIRRELAVLPLIEMDLTMVQLFVGSVVALFYIPCLAVVGVLVKEFGLKVGASISALTIVFALIFGGVINQFMRLISLLGV